MAQFFSRLARIGSVVAIASLGLLTSCLESDEGVKLAADGSGKIVATYKTDLGKAGEFLEMASMFLAPEQADGISVKTHDPFHPAWFRQAAKGVEGFTIDKAERTETKSHRTTTIHGSFTNLQAAAKGGAFFNASVTLEKTVYPVPAEAKPGEDAPEPNAWKLTLRPIMASQYRGMKVSDLLAGFADILKGMKLTRRVTVPAKILHTNLKIEDDGMSVVQVVDFKKLTESQQLPLEIIFEQAEGQKLEAFTHTPNLQSMAPRFQNPAPKEAVTTPSAVEEAPKDGE